jgi:hypothetical protein
MKRWGYEGYGLWRLWAMSYGLWAMGYALTARSQEDVQFLICGYRRPQAGAVRILP